MTKIYIGTFQVKASFYRPMSQYLWSTSRFRSVTNSISRYRLVSDTLGVKSADSASATEDPKRRIVPSKVNNTTHMPQCSAATIGYNVAFFRITLIAAHCTDGLLFLAPSRAFAAQSSRLSLKCLWLTLSRLSCDTLSR